MYNKILVPLDGSKMAECVLEEMKTVARGCNVPEVILLFVAEPISAGLYQSSTEGREKLIAWGKDYLAKVEKSLLTENIRVKGLVLEGKAADTIVDYTHKNQIDLVVMSTHGWSGPSRWAFGSVADRVIRTSSVSVLIVVPKECRIG